MEKAKTTVKAKTTEHKADFAGLLRDYETQARQGKNTQAYTDSIVNLATSVAYSVLKKCIDVSQNPQLKEVRHSIARDTAQLKAIDYTSKHAYETVYTQDGDRQRQIADTDIKNELDRLTRQALGDGLDLVNTAVVAILDETAKADTSKENFLELPYEVRRLKKKVWIKTEDSVNGWETVETTPIQEIYKAVRRAIDSSRAMSTDARNGYTYLEELAKDTETDAETVVYRRLSKYADLGGYATDYNGACTLYSADSKTVADTDEIIASLELTAKQAKVLQLRLSGYGYKAIATYLGVTQRAVAKTVQSIQKKAVDCCMFTESALTRYTK